MLKSAIAAALLFGIAGSLPASAAEVVFLGRVVYSGFTGTCDVSPTGVREIVRFKPAGLGANGANTVVTVQWRTGGGEVKYAPGTAYTLVRASLDETFRNVKGVTFNNGVKNFVNVPAIRVITSAPDPILATTTFVTATGEIKNWEDHLGCTAQFRTAMTKQIRP